MKKQINIYHIISIIILCVLTYYNSIMSNDIKNLMKRYEINLRDTVKVVNVMLKDIPTKNSISYISGKCVDYKIWKDEWENTFMLPEEIIDSYLILVDIDGGGTIIVWSKYPPEKELKFKGFFIPSEYKFQYYSNYDKSFQMFFPLTKKIL
jgi:hypothetical protein